MPHPRIHLRATDPRTLVPTTPGPPGTAPGRHIARLAGRSDLSVVVAPGAGGGPACFYPCLNASTWWGRGCGRVTTVPPGAWVGRWQYSIRSSTSDHRLLRCWIATASLLRLGRPLRGEGDTTFVL